MFQCSNSDPASPPSDDTGLQRRGHLTHNWNSWRVSSRHAEDVFAVSPALVDLDEGKTTIQVTNPNNHTFTLEVDTTLAHFRIPTPHQAANITPMPVEHLNLITKNPDEAEAVINQMFMNPDMKATKWYPTPETCSEPDNFNAIERRIYDEILTLWELEKLDLSQSDDQWMNFLKNFTWDEWLLTPSQRLQVEEFLVK